MTKENKVTKKKKGEHFDYSVILKTYKKLELDNPYMFTKMCDILKVPRPNNSNSRKAILKVLDTVVVREEVNKKHIIKSFIDIKPKQAKEKVKVVDNRGKSEGSRCNNKGIFKEDLLASLLYFCVSCAERDDLYEENGDDFVITKSRHDLMCEMGMRNKHNSYVANVQPNNFCNTLNVQRSTFDYVLNKVNQNSHNAMKDIIDTLVKSGLAIKRDTMKIIKYKKIYDYDNNKFHYDKNLIEEERIATEEEYIQISHIKREVATSMGFKNESQIHGCLNNEIRGEFYNKVNTLTEKRFGISAHFPLVKLHMKNSNIDGYLKKFNNISLDELMEIGNYKFLKQQKKTLKTSATKYKNGTPSKNKLAYVQLFDNYMEDSDNIVQHLIDIFAPKIELNMNGDLVLDHPTGKFVENEN